MDSLNYISFNGSRQKIIRRHYENYSVILKFSANIIILSARTF